MEIRPTEIKDLPLVMEIYDYARAFMRATGNTTQWIDGYPSEALICQEIEEVIALSVPVNKEKSWELFVSSWEKILLINRFMKVHGSMTNLME